MQSSSRRMLYIIGILIVLVLAFLRWGVGLYINFLWFDSLGYSSVFYTILFSEIGLWAATGAVVFVILLVNLFLTRKPLLDAFNAPKHQEYDGVIDMGQSPWKSMIKPRYVNYIFILASLVLAFFVSSAVKDNWIIMQQYFNASSFNITDPIFNKDVGFYTFKLPFYQFIYQVLMWVTVLSALAVGVIYFFINSSRGGIGRLFSSISARYHLSALAAFFFIIKAWGYKLDQYRLLFSGEGVVFGAGYTDVNARLLALKILMIVALAVAVLIIINIFLRRFKLVAYSIGTLVAVSILLGGIYPAIIQNFIVSPNELQKEKPYLKHNIKYTRLAYNLDNIEEKSFPAGQTLSKEEIEDSEETIQNIRLWDWRLLQSTYSQLQEMRTYYEFKNVDIDRYHIDGDYRQVMLSAREMDQSKLADQAQTWVNQHLKYTHGFGLVMSPVNEITEEGLPNLFLKNIPPETNYSNLQVEKPQIYYGESTDDYVIVNAETQEFDYPKGGGNAYTTYQADSGIEISNVFRKAVLALGLGDYRMFVSPEVNTDSRVLMRRNIKERVPRIAGEFLNFDGDPYFVVNEGKLYWMWDAYTTASMFPYSEPFNNKFNYIRNSVKVVVDAYSGAVDFYAAKPDEPVLKTLDKIFPDLFQPISEMPDGLRSHVRYPVDLFSIQSQKYTNYHMQNPQVFYNKEDKWTLPSEQYGNEEQVMEPYYTIARLPGMEKAEFILIRPFTPKNKKNMISWLAARSDGENYGKLLNYNFPKQELVYGPMQVEARITQDSYISQQISLWDQRGSNVNRGNLIVIPVQDSLLYVEPLYLQADQSQLPELRRVIVSYADNIVMEPTLDQALKRLFNMDNGKEGAGEPQPGIPGPGGEITRLPQLIDRANRLYNEAQEQLRAGNWSGYGETIDELGSVLEKISKYSAPSPGNTGAQGDNAGEPAESEAGPGETT